MRAALIAATLAFASLPLVACVGMPPATASAVDRLQSRYDQLRPYAELVLPHLPPARAARVRLALATIERALTAARVAASLVEQQRALAIADAALAVVPAPAAASPAN